MNPLILEEWTVKQAASGFGAGLVPARHRLVYYPKTNVLRVEWLLWAGNWWPCVRDTCLVVFK